MVSKHFKTLEQPSFCVCVPHNSYLIMVIENYSRRSMKFHRLLNLKSVSAISS